MSMHRDDAGAKLGMWLFLFSEIFLFGGLFILYAVYLSRYPGDFSHAGRRLDILLGSVNTIILLTSSLFAAMAVTAVQRGDARRCMMLLWGTIACAGIFMVNKAIEWSAKFEHGIYPGSPHLASGAPGQSIFFSLYYLTTGLHGLHVTAGAAVLAWIGMRVRKGTVHADSYVALENGTLYWHLVDLVWIFIFPLYYLIL